MTNSRVLALNSIPTLEVIEKAFPGLSAVFFDMDGTLFDTEKYHTEAMFMIGRKFNIRPPHGPKEVHAMMHGKADYLVYEIIKYWEGFPKEWSAQDFIATKNKNLMEILSNLDPQEYFPKETASLLSELKAANKFVALVTSSEKLITNELLTLVGLDQFFDLVLTRDDCPQHKPDPWPYIEAMRIAKSDSHDSLIFEDSKVGLMAAEDSGAHVIKVEWFTSP